MKQIITRVLFAILGTFCLGSLVYAEWTVTLVEVIDESGDVGQHSSLTIDDQGKLAVSYYDVTNAKLKFAIHDGVSWSIEEVDSAGDVGQYSSLTIDALGRRNLSYYDASRGALKYAGWATTPWNWQSEVVDSDDDVGQFSSLTLTELGGLAVSYYDVSNALLKFAIYDGVCWSLEEVDSIGDVGQYSSLAIDASGRRNLSYYDATDGALKYAGWATTPWSWQSEVVDSDGDVGQYSSLTLTELSGLAVSYYDVNNMSLKFAIQGKGGWSAEEVDNIGDVGKYSSLAIDHRGEMGISYYDATSGDLKYAKTEASPWLVPKSIPYVGADEVHHQGITGQGLTVSVLEPGGVADQNHPVLAGRMAVVDYSGAGLNIEAHPTAVAGIIGGVGFGYAGMAPSVSLRSGRTDNESQLINAVENEFLQGSRVLNLSVGMKDLFGNWIYPGNGQAAIEKASDHIVENNKVSVVVSAGNHGSNGAKTIGVPGAAYNVITVGATVPGEGYQKTPPPWDGNHPESSRGPTGDGRCKPDIIAPGFDIDAPVAMARPPEPLFATTVVGVTSAAAPHVSGAVALLLEVSADSGNPSTMNPKVIKAILLNSAEKLINEYILWKHKPSQPLDYVQGAGQLRVDRAYQLMRAGEYDPGAIPDLSWSLESVDLGSKVNYSFENELNPGDRVTAMLVWERRGVGAPTYERDVLSNLDLALINEGALDTVAVSQSTVDNVEHIVFEIPADQGGNYRLEVLSLAGEWPYYEWFALAWNVDRFDINEHPMVVSNGSFATGNLAGFEVAGSGTAECIALDSGYSDFYAAELTGGSQISLTQTVDVPTEPFFLLFQRRFLSDGSLEVKLGEVILDLVLNAAGEDADFYLTKLEIDPEALGIAGVSASLTFTFISEAGGRLWVDNIDTAVIPIPGDFDSDGDVDLADLQTLLQHWLEVGCGTPNWCSGTDFDQSTNVDFADFAIFAEHWLEGTGQ